MHGLTCIVKYEAHGLLHASQAVYQLSSSLSSNIITVFFFPWDLELVVLFLPLLFRAYDYKHFPTSLLPVLFILNFVGFFLCMHMILNDTFKSAFPLCTMADILIPYHRDIFPIPQCPLLYPPSVNYSNAFT